MVKIQSKFLCWTFLQKNIRINIKNPWPSKKNQTYENKAQII